MAEDLPSEYDAIILGTGLPESVVAAALSRIGYKVLHLDRNDYYSGYWASFSFDSLQEWIKRNSEEETENCKNLEATHGEICFPSRGNAITNIEVRSYLRNVEPENSEDVDNSGVNNANLVSDPSDGNVGNVTDVSEDLTPHEPEHVSELSSDTAETHEDHNTSCNSSYDAQPRHEVPITSEHKTEELSNTSVVSKVEQNDVSHVTGSNIGPESGDGQKNDITERVEQSDVSKVTGSNISPESGDRQKNDITERVKQSDVSEVTGSNISPESGDGQKNDITERVKQSDVSEVTGSNISPESGDRQKNDITERVEQSDVSEVTGSNISPESEDVRKDGIKEPSEESPAVHNVISWAEKRKVKNAKKLDRNSTHKDFSEKSRKFNLDLSPKVIFSRGLLVESLINANISHYAEFKIVSRILTYMNGKIEEVPCSRSDVFGSELINVLEKRALMRFMTFCSTFEDCPEQYESFQDKPFMDFLKSRKLTTNLQHIILYAIACVHANTPTLSGLKATQKFLRSLGRYGNTPFLWSLYGAGELPQAFCRMCAVFGGIYCLRKNVKSLVLDDDNKNCLAVISEDGQRLNTKWLIMETSYAPDVFAVVTQSMTSRAIIITDRSLRPAVREHISMLTLQSRSIGSPVRVIELAPSSMACPESLCVVHFTTETVANALEDLNYYVEDLFTTPDAANSDSEKPVMLWSVYFNMESGVPTNTNKLPSNVRITSLPSAQLDFEDALKEAKDIFTSICPNEDFLPAVPNPEDIIWDDIGSNTKEEPGEQAGDDVIPATDQQYSEVSTEECVEHPHKDPSEMNAREMSNPGEISTCDESPSIEDGNQGTSSSTEIEA